MFGERHRTTCLTVFPSALKPLTLALAPLGAWASRPQFSVSCCSQALTFAIALIKFRLPRPVGARYGAPTNGVAAALKQQTHHRDMCGALPGALSRASAEHKCTLTPLPHIPRVFNNIMASAANLLIFQRHYGPAAPSKELSLILKDILDSFYHFLNFVADLFAEEFSLRPSVAQGV